MSLSLSLPLVISKHSGQQIQLPAQYNDFLPGDLIPDHPPALVPPPNLALPVAFPDKEPQRLADKYWTDPNEFGLFQIYPRRPRLDPDANIPLHSLVDTPTLEQNLPQAST